MASWSAQLLEMKVWSTTTNLKWRGKTKLTKPQQNSACWHLWEKWCRCYLRITKAHLQSTTHPRRLVTSTPYCNLLRNHLRPDIRPKHHMDCSILVSCCCMTRLGHILPMSELRQAGTFIMSPASDILAWLHPLWLSYLWATQEGSCWKDFPIWWSARGGAWVAMHEAKLFLFMRNPGMVMFWTCTEHKRHYAEKQKSCTETICTKSAGKKILRFSFHSPT
jgi:hypothetical protein